MSKDVLTSEEQITSFLNDKNNKKIIKYLLAVLI